MARSTPHIRSGNRCHSGARTWPSSPQQQETNHSPESITSYLRRNKLNHGAHGWTRTSAGRMSRGTARKYKTRPLSLRLVPMAGLEPALEGCRAEPRASTNPSSVSTIGAHGWTRTSTGRMSRGTARKYKTRPLSLRLVPMAGLEPALEGCRAVPRASTNPSSVSTIGAHGWTRTSTGRILSPLSLPLDYMGTKGFLSQNAAYGNKPCHRHVEPALEGCRAEPRASIKPVLCLYRWTTWAQKGF